MTGTTRKDNARFFDDNLDAVPLHVITTASGCSGTADVGPNSQEETGVDVPKVPVAGTPGRGSVVS